MAKWMTSLAALVSVSGLCSIAIALPIDHSVKNINPRGLKPIPIAEGLYDSAPPDFLASAWANTFVIYGEDAKAETSIWGTAFPVMKKRIGAQNYVLLLTAGHVGDPVDKLSDDDNDLLVIAQDMGLDKDQDNAESSFVGKLPYEVESIETSQDLDASAILITLPDAAFANITPFHFAANGCQVSTGVKNYVIGFPAVSNRPIANQNVKISSPMISKKRWSEGFMTDEGGFDDFQDDGDSAIKLDGSTVDALEGSSGSPTLDASGNLIGMLNAGDDDAHYTGNEAVTPMKPYSYLAPCGKLQKFAKNKWALMAPKK